MQIRDCVQGSPEWHEARRAMITGTKMDDVMGSEWSKLMLACELIAEEATEETKQGRVTQEMARGIEKEVEAREYFMQKTGKVVEEIGFCISDDLPVLGISGDGWIKNGDKYTEAIEIKCPDSKNAVFYKLESLFTPEELGLGSWSKPTKAEPEPIFKPSAKAPFASVPVDYKWQSVTYFLVNEDLETLHFIIYDDRFASDDNKMTVIELQRSSKEVQEAIDEAKQGLTDFIQQWKKLRSKIIN